MNTMTTWRAVGLAALAVIAAAGCAQPDRARDDLGPTPRLMLTPDSAEQGQAWYDAWLDEPDTPGDSPIRSSGLIGASARSGEPGIARILCRFVLSSTTSELIRVDGSIRIILIARPMQPDEQVVGTWSLTASEAAEHFRYGNLPGYRLDLFWPRVAGTSTYRLIVRWDNPVLRARQTTVISFEDTFGYDTRTKRPIR
jgi:hypothetical protein